jgi:hypothetical protein
MPPLRDSLARLFRQQALRWPPPWKNASERFWRLLEGPACARSPPGLASILGQCSGSALLSSRERSSTRLRAIEAEKSTHHRESPGRSGASSYPAGRLIRYLDPISPNGLNRLITVRREVGPSLRLVKGLCLLKTIPLHHTHALGWGRPLEPDNLSAGGPEITTTCLHLCSLDTPCNISSPLSIKRFEFGDGVGFFGS